MPRVRRVVAMAIAGGALLMGVGMPAATQAVPYTVQEKKAAVKRLEAKLEAYGVKVEAAAERYNGAQWKLGNIRTNITKNQKVLEKAIADLHLSQRILGDRLEALYRHPDPGLVEVLVSSGSLTDAVDQVDAIQRAGTEDARVVGNMERFRDRTIRVRAELVKDREAAKVEVANAAKEKQRVEAILAERRQVLENAQADLRQAIAEAAAARAAAARAQASSGYTRWTGPLPDGSANADAVKVALQFQGVPYVWGGASPSGFDCSGLASYAYAQIGKSVPHYTVAIWNAFPHVPMDQLEPGDMILMHGLGHMGIYIGNGMLVHAPHTGDVVRVAPLSSFSGIDGAVRA